MILGALIPSMSFAQNEEEDPTQMIIHFKDGQEKSFNIDDIDHVRFDAAKPVEVSTLPIEYMAEHCINTEGSEEFPKATDYSLLQAFKYKLVDELKMGNTKSMLEIRVRYLGNNKKNITLDDISKSDFWEQDKDNDIVRCIPMAGLYLVTDENGDPTGEVYGMGTDANLWSSTDDPIHDNWAFKAYAGYGGAYVIGELEKSNAYPIVPFKNAQK